MRLILGLGNPGAGYADTRHNAGFLVADFLVTRWDFPRFRKRWRLRARTSAGTRAAQAVTIVKPQTYMNRSGVALARFPVEPGFEPPRDLLVLVDEVALPLGGFRIRARGSAGGHNGLKSIADVLQSDEYPRLRIGVGPPPDDVWDLAEYVLAPFTPDERARLDTVLPTLADAVECWISEGTEAAMNQFNQLGKPE